MKILFVSAGYPPGSRGGTEGHARDLAGSLRAAGHDVAVFCREGDAGRAEFAVRDEVVDGVSVRRINYNFGDATSFAFIHDNSRIDAEFVGYLDVIRPDVVHVHHLTCLSTGILDRVAERGIALVMTLHDFWMVCPRGQRIREELEICHELDRERCAPCLTKLWPHFEITPSILAERDVLLRTRLLRCDALITPSAFHRERMLEFGLDPRRLSVVEHGLDHARFTAARRVRSSVKRIGFIGSVLPSKGVHLLVEAFNRMGRHDLGLDIFGEAPTFHGDSGFEGRLRALARPDLDIRFHGPYEPDAVATKLAQIDLLVVPSLWWESFCLTIREGLLAGIPVVASNIGAMAEAYRDGAGGRQFTAGDPGDLTRVLTEIVDDPALYRGLTASISSVRTISDAAEETLRIYAAARARRAPLPLPAGKRKGGAAPYATVFFPTWNGGALFERILDRVLAQETSFDFEVLVIDSGSGDGTVEAVRSRAGVRLIQIPNSEFNHGLTRNLGVREARGEIVALLTQDAEPIDTHWLERLVANFDDPEVAGAYCHQQPRPDCNPFQRDRLKGWTREAGAPEIKQLSDPAAFGLLSPFERYRLIAFDDVASCVRKSVMAHIPFERRQFGEDIAWAKQAILNGHRIVNDPRSVVIHSHNSPVLYEFKRVYLDHQNIHDLVGLHTIPRLWLVATCSMRAFAHLLPIVWRDDRSIGYRLWWTLKLPLYAFTQNLAQYLGARSVGWKRAGRMQWFDRWMRRAV